MGWERIAENKIREAMREGAFDVPGERGPIDLDEYFKLPVELRLAYSVLKSSGCVPEEVEMLNEIARLERELTAAPDHAAKEKLTQSIADARLRLELALDRKRRGQL